MKRPFLQIVFPRKRFIRNKNDDGFRFSCGCFKKNLAISNYSGRSIFLYCSPLEDKSFTVSLIEGNFFSYFSKKARFFLKNFYTRKVSEAM